MPSYPTFGPPDYLALAQKIGDPKQNNPLQALAERQTEVDQALQGNRNEMARALRDWANPQPTAVRPPPKDPDAEYRGAMLRHLATQYPQARIEHLEDAVDEHMRSLKPDANAASQPGASYGTY